MAIGGRACALPVCAALTLWSGDAAAVVLPPCSTLFVRVAPAPIEARDVAVYLAPNSDGGGFSLQWLDAEGAEVPFELFVPGTSGRIYLRPSIAIAEGTHTLVYSDDCTAQDAGSVELPLAFVPGPPPPAPDELGELIVAYEAYCPGAASAEGFARNFPPVVSVMLDMNPALEPYAPFMHVSVRDDTGTIDSEYWNVAWASSFGVHSMPACGGWSPAIPIGARTFTLDAEILDGTRYDTLTVVADIECAQCEPVDMPSTGGASGASGTGGASGMPELEVVDAGEAPVRSMQASGGCSLSNTRGSFGSWLVLLVLVLSLRAQMRHTRRPP